VINEDRFDRVEGKTLMNIIHMSHQAQGA
jgi:hypothetical protein